VIEKGKATVSTQGYVGKACQDATAELEKVMGMTVTDEKTPEWHQEEVRTNPQG
jgi:hypothetical protein